MKKIFVALLLTILGGASLAQSSSFGSWTTGPMSDNDGLYAGTANESGSILGQYCLRSNSNCYWLVKNDINCKQDDSYPAMVNSDTGATHVELYCLVIDGSPRLVFKNFDTIDIAVKASKKIGIVLPMTSGNFKVTRFDLVGANRAISVMRKNFESLRSGSATKDTTI